MATHAVPLDKHRDVLRIAKGLGELLKLRSNNPEPDDGTRVVLGTITGATFGVRRSVGLNYSLLAESQAAAEVIRGRLANPEDMFDDFEPVGKSHNRSVVTRAQFTIDILRHRVPLE